MNDIFTRLTPFIADIFGTDEELLSEKTELYGDLCADEYDFIELSMIIEEEFELTLKDGWHDGIETLGQLCDYISEGAGD